VCRRDNVARRAAPEEVTIKSQSIATYLRSGFVREKIRFCPEACRNTGALGEGTEASRWGGWSRVAAWARGGLHCSIAIVAAGDCRTYTLFGGGRGRSWRDAGFKAIPFKTAQPGESGCAPPVPNATNAPSPSLWLRLIVMGRREGARRRRRVDANKVRL
jgi:hypothetical protein